MEFLEEDDIEEALKSVDINQDSFTEDRELSGIQQWADLPILKVEKGFHIKTGGAGVVFQCRETRNGRKMALKIPRPSELKKEEEERTADEQNQRAASAEAAQNARLSHPNVSYLWDADSVVLPVTQGGRERTATILLHEWIPNATPLDEYVYNEVSELNTLIRLFSEVFEGLSHLHDKGLIHWDVKAENCLVNEVDGHIQISDMGNAQEISDNEELEESVNRYTTDRCWPEQKREDLDKERGSDRALVTIEAGNKSVDEPWLDLYMAGRMIGRICGLENELNMADDLDDHEKEIREKFLAEMFEPGDEHAQMVRKFLILVCRRLLKPLDSGGYKNFPVFYESSNDVNSDLSKILHHFGGAEGIKELYPIPQQSIRAPVTDNTEFSPRIEGLSQGTPAKRLMGHEQLGLTHFVYPGARHSRFEHLIGTIATTLEYVRSLYADRTNPTFRLLCDSIDIRALIFAAATHDLGHIAFSHYLEEDEPLFEGCSHEAYIRAVLLDDLDLYDGFVPSAVESEVRAQMEADRRALKRCVNEDGWIRKDEPYEEDAEDFLKLVGEILDPPELSSEGDFEPDLTSRQDSELAKKYILHSIIDSVLDADKLDYLRRDAVHAGLDYPEGADVDRFLQSLTVATKSPSPSVDEPFRPTIAVNQKGVGPLESLLLSRYQVFKSMYWHRVARSATCLLKFLVRKYMVSHTSSISVGDRREDSLLRQRAKLLHNFRMKDDQEVLRWLLTRVDEEVSGIDDEHHQRFEQALRHRNQLPKPIFDISQGEIQPSDMEKSEYQKTAENILEKHDILNDYPHFEYAEMWESITGKTCELIQQRINATIDESTDRPACPELTEYDLFIDVPIPDKDQISNLWVSDRGNRLPTRSPDQGRLDFEGDGETVIVAEEPDHHLYEFSQYSKIGEDVQEAFDIWARRIRVFVWPSVQEQILKCLDGNQEQLAKIVIESLEEAYEDEIPSSEHVTEEAQSRSGPIDE